MKKALLSGLLLLGLGSVVSAEPSPNVTMLMNEPVSQFSIGMYRLRMAVEAEYGHGTKRFDFGEPVEGGSSFTANASYDWDRNRIVIEIDSLNLSVDPEEECAHVVNVIRWDGRPEPHTPKKSSFAQHFLPDGYPSAKLEDAAKELDQIIEIKYVNMAILREVPFTCTAPLIGTGYTIQK